MKSFSSSENLKNSQITYKLKFFDTALRQTFTGSSVRLDRVREHEKEHFTSYLTLGTVEK